MPEQIVEDFEREGILLKTEDYVTKSVTAIVARPLWSQPVHAVVCSDQALAEPAIRAVRRAEPESSGNVEKTYLNGWRISRIGASRADLVGPSDPGLYCDACGEVIVSSKTPDACPRRSRRCDRNGCAGYLVQLRLWLSPPGWPKETKELKTSTDIRSRDWLRYSFLLGSADDDDGLKFMGMFPSGCLHSWPGEDEKGEKYSKTRGMWSIPGPDRPVRSGRASLHPGALTMREAI